VRTILEQLAARGAHCHAVTACCFDVPPGDRVGELLRARGLTQSAQVDGVNVPVWQGRVAGVEYNTIALPTQLRNQLTAIEEMIYRDAIVGWLAQNKPDIVLTYGGFLLENEVQRCARAAGARVVFYLANPNYMRPETFANTNLILANSGAVRDHYLHKMKLDSHAIGLFVARSSEPITKIEPRFITFVNPLPEKGVTVFLKLVERAANDAPDMRFLVVESRGILAEAMRKLNLPAELLKQVTVIGKQENLSAVYRQTAVLLVPSLWFEAAGRVLVEANANGIPVLASNGGGIPETLGQAGCLLPVPERCRADFWTLPTRDEIAPWWDELARLWFEPDHHRAMSQKALVAAETYDLSARAATLEILLRSILPPAGGN
jgi:glycosyltransferase involved in cell wall biosynthesis